MIQTSPMRQIERARGVGAPESLFAEIPIEPVSKELYNKTREALGKKGFIFVAIKPVSTYNLVIYDASFFGYLNLSTEVIRHIPPQIEVAIDPKNFKIKGSNNLLTDGVFQKIQERETALRRKLPKDVRDLISLLRFMPSSILIQLDLEHQRQTEKALFTDWFGRGVDDRTVPDRIVRVGRSDPTRKLDVDAVGRDNDSRVFAVSAVMLPRKLPA